MRRRHRTFQIQALVSWVLGLVVLLSVSESVLCRVDGTAHRDAAAWRGVSSALQHVWLRGSYLHGLHAGSATTSHHHVIKHAGHWELCTLPMFVAWVGHGVTVSREPSSRRLHIEDKSFVIALARLLHALPRAPPLFNLA